MISQLRGILLEATMSQAVIDVGGVGYEVGISGTTAAALPQAGDEVRLYTRMRVSSDAVALFGFSRQLNAACSTALWRFQAWARAWRFRCSPPFRPISSIRQ